MRFSIAAIGATALLAVTTQAFAPTSTIISQHERQTTSTSSSLYAVGALAKKAKEASLREYVKNGIDDDVMEKYKIIKEALAKEEDDENESNNSSSSEEVMGPLQQEIHRRKGTITVIAEYKRKLSGSGYIKEVFEPIILSPEFREFGASGIAVMADERMGGCTYEDLNVFVEDQRRAHSQVPGPVRIINNDLIIDELQIARTAACGAAAVVIILDVVGEEGLKTLLKAAKAVDLEAIVAISTRENAQRAIDMGARMISVVNVDGVDAKTEVISDLNIPEGQTVSFIANIIHKQDKGLGEVEEAWACRDKGFQCAWVSDALYKAGNSGNEHPGAILKSMKSKSSLRWASPVAQSGRGEGAREYLGDILM